MNNTVMAHAKASREKPDMRQAIEGSLLGLMVGDAIGLPLEGIGPRRIERFLTKGLHPRLLLGRAMISDDSEHALMTAAALTAHWGQPQRFSRSLAWRLRWWFARLPAGVGMATARSIIKLWLGFPPRYSGVFSAGNGPAMRAPVIGVVLGDAPVQMLECLAGSTQMTHRDPKALMGAVAVAQAAWVASQQKEADFDAYLASLQTLIQSAKGAFGLSLSLYEDFLKILRPVQEALTNGDDITQVAQQMGLGKGVTGYMYHTVPLSLLVAFRYQDDYRLAIESIVRLGGDADTTAAIVGGIVGAHTGRNQIPVEWLKGIADWPMNPVYATALASQLAHAKQSGQSAAVRWLPGPLILLRNLFFLTVVLTHGFRRLLPPY